MKCSIRKLTVLAGAAVLTGTLAVAAVYPGPGGQKAKPGIGPAYRVALARVGLTTEQKGRIRAIVVAERPNVEALRGQQQTSKAALDAALQAPSPDPTAVGNALLRTRADRQALRAEMKKLRNQTVSVLTPEQRAKLDGYLEGSRALRRRNDR
jgi:Spy/CpxP family protein refolding chaperone